MVSAMFPILMAFLAAIRANVLARAELEAEILALRHQLAVLQRAAPKRPHLSRADRLLWVLYAAAFEKVRQKCGSGAESAATSSGLC